MNSWNKGIARAIEYIEESLTKEIGFMELLHLPQGNMAVNGILLRR